MAGSARPPKTVRSGAPRRRGGAAGLGRVGLVVGVLALLAIMAALPFAVRARYEGFSVPSESMVPTLLAGDYILVDKAFDLPRRGDLIVFRDPHDDGEILVKRVVGLGGEDLAIRGREVFIGCRPGARECKPLLESYTRFEDRPHRPERGAWAVPPGEFFVMADNRNVGEDSRHFGFVSLTRIVGRPLFVYWSTNPQTGAVRWSRLGRSVRH